MVSTVTQPVLTPSPSPHTPAPLQKLKPSHATHAQPMHAHKPASPLAAQTHTQAHAAVPASAAHGFTAVHPPSQAQAPAHLATQAHATVSSHTPGHSNVDTAAAAKTAPPSEEKKSKKNCK